MALTINGFLALTTTERAAVTELTLDPEQTIPSRSPNDFSTLLTCLRECRRVRSISLSGHQLNRLRTDHLYQLIDALVACPKLQHIDFHQNGLEEFDETRIQMISSRLQGAPALMFLSGLSISHALEEGLKERYLSSVTSTSIATIPLLCAKPSLKPKLINKVLEFLGAELEFDSRSQATREEYEHAENRGMADFVMCVEKAKRASAKRIIFSSATSSQRLQPCTLSQQPLSLLDELPQRLRTLAI